MEEVGGHGCNDMLNAKVSTGLSAQTEEAQLAPAMQIIDGHMRRLWRRRRRQWHCLGLGATKPLFWKGQRIGSLKTQLSSQFVSDNTRDAVPIT